MRLTRPPLSYMPLLPILTGVVAGVLCVRFLPVSPWITVAAALAAAVLAALSRRTAVLVEIFLSLSLAAVATAMALPRQFAGAPDRGTVVSGVVTDVALLPAHQRLIVDVDAAAGRPFRMQVTYPSFEPVIEAGSKVSLSGTYSLPSRSTDLPLEDDMSAYCYNNGISLLCYVPKGSLDVTGRSGNIFLALKRWRTAVVDKLFSSALDEGAAVFLAAVLTGDSSSLEASVRREYAVAGVAHVLALSGAHVAVIAFVISVLLMPLVVAGHRKARWWITVAALWGYALFTGMSPSVCRAVIMASAVLLALIFDRPRSSLNALCLAAILILVFSPLSLMQPGFQLSFAATLSIILFTPRLMPDAGRGMRGYRIWAAAAATLAATMGTFPLVAIHFHTVPVYFFIANIAAVAVMPVMISAGFLYVVLLFLGAEPTWLALVLDNVYSLFDAVVEAVAHLPGASVDGIYPDAWLALPMYAVVAFVAAFLYLRHKCWLALAGATLLFTVGVASALRPDYPDGEAYMVRSGKATTVALHRGDTLRMLTTSPPRNFTYDSLMWSDRYRDYIATRGISCIDIHPLDSLSLRHDAMLRFGRRTMVVAHAMPRPAPDYSGVKPDYCLVTARWYGDPVALSRKVHADTIVLGSDINRRRRRRYASELDAAGVPYVDLGGRRLGSR
ncbi:MAG: ComEC/Rec2 family competence protein [Muribaculaceae bacterium]|nr:ComEC/Rec2 family competence protein [Muribaculaceae bacterium]